ncbi:hypothetical protein [Candidatus Nanohalobium constans]|uniref:Uncharacterized protein n=1 Tax=Candidatus Nanohalobium constans TaxID=2565781 RepID=A0A5Q0UFU6_9ARCH|nr:hypothetical protein [Candidatus Nanohalobium constans]QGA80478.1 hypothetical protein LC1Nh_0582 [Candidatus Nanohalobium constans]
MEGFEEVQRFRQKWLWALVLSPFILVFASFYIQNSFQGLPVMIAALAATVGFLYSVKLNVKVEDDGIHIKLFPLHLKDRVINFDEIESFSAEEYRPIREFGGWGLRWRPGKIAYSTGGSKGVRIKREGKRDVMIGSRKPEKLAEAIRDMKSDEF